MSKAETFHKKMRQDFMAAIDRLEREEPLEASLKAKKKRGNLKINKSSVALEAGHTRVTLDRHHDVLDRIRELSQPKKTSSNSYDRIKNIREDKKLLNDELDLALTKSAAIILRMEKLKTKHQRDIRNLNREIKHLKNPKNRSDSNIIAGRFSEGLDEDD